MDAIGRIRFKGSCNCLRAMWLALAIRASREVASWAKFHLLLKLMGKLSVFKLNSLCSQYGPGLGRFW